MKTIRQKFASDVYARVSEYKDKGENDQQKYRTMAMKLPFLVQKAGLVQALAFVKMKAESDPIFKDLLRHLSQVVIKQGENDENESEEPILLASRTNDLREYILLTRRTMMALEWFKRYAQSVLKDNSITSQTQEDPT